MQLIFFWQRIAARFLAGCLVAGTAIGESLPLPTPPALAEQNPLVWDTMVQQHEIKAGEITNQFIFYVTNTGPNEVSNIALRPSCGCTVAQLPFQPWKLGPGQSGPITATVNFAGKSGLLTKMVFVDSSAGSQTLTLRLNIPVTETAMPNRQRNLQMALANPQAVFQNDCASCHAAPAHDKTGEPLFKAVCSICHEAEHRAQFVSDLSQPKQPTDALYWKKWISEGSAGRDAGRNSGLMPAFSEGHGGPLSDDQIASLIKYSMTRFPWPPPSRILSVPADNAPIAPRAFVSPPFLPVPPKP